MKKITASQLLVFSALGWMLIGILSLSIYQNTYLPAIKYAGIIILLDGLLLTAVSFQCNGIKKEKRWIRTEALVNLSFSILLILDPVFTALIFVFLVTPWVVTKGLITMIAALSMRKSVEGWRGDFSGGAMLVACGLLISHNPTENPFGVNILIGAIGCTISLLYFYDAYRFRQVHHLLHVVH